MTDTQRWTLCGTSDTWVRSSWVITDFKYSVILRQIYKSCTVPLKMEKFRTVLMEMSGEVYTDIQYLSQTCCVQAGVQMLVIQRASYKKPTCCIGMAHSNHGITLLFTGSCGRSGLYQTPLEDSLWFDLIKTTETCWVSCFWSARRDSSFLHICVNIVFTQFLWTFFKL